MAEERAQSPSMSKFRHHRRSSSSYSNGAGVEDDRESTWGDFPSGLASPVMSVAGSVSGTSTAYSSTYNVAGLASGSSTPGGHLTAGPGAHSPSVLPIMPLGAMNLEEVDEGQRAEEVEEMEVDA